MARITEVSTSTTEIPRERAVVATSSSAVTKSSLIA
jgi:hypothetical protein